MYVMGMLIDYAITVLSFALFVACPRLAGMCAITARVRAVNPYVVSSLGVVVSLPIVLLMTYLVMNVGAWAAILVAVLTDILAAVLMGTLSIKYAIEIAILALFVWAGVYVASKLSTIIVTAIAQTSK